MKTQNLSIKNAVVTRINVILMILIFCTVQYGCEKFLDEKSDQKFVLPSTIPDLQSLLDDYFVINLHDPNAGESSSDNYYLTDKIWSSNLSEQERRIYTWEGDKLFPVGMANDWSASYDVVYKANLVLENLEKISGPSVVQSDWNNVKGQALFLRGKSFLQVAHIWTLAYDKATSSTDLGIPLRLTSDFNIPSVRSSVQETYDQIIGDLNDAAIMLPVTPLHKVRPSRPAAYALLARAYLSMRDYDSCMKYANLSLQFSSQLIDYNEVTEQPFPFMQFNIETIFYSVVGTQGPIGFWNARVDSMLYNSYESNDLRKSLFFEANGDGSYYFGGSYDPSYLFTGIATDEVYLMRAECYARKGNSEAAMKDLNLLLSKRWKKGAFRPFEVSTDREALKLILNERRKELIFRGIRWMDIKRLNKEGANITLKRIMRGQVYTLLPNDLRYALAIPEDVISLSGMKQNPR